MLEEIKSFGVQPSEEAITNVVETRLRDEIRRGVQTIQYQVVTLMTTNGQAPFITVFMYLGEARNEQERKDLAIIIEETLRQRIEGVKNEKGVWITPAFPKLIYVLEEDNITEDSPYWGADEAGGPLHSQADGSGLYLGEKDARAEALQRRNAGPRRRVYLHGLPQLPDARPLRHRLEQRRKRRQL